MKFYSKISWAVSILEGVLSQPLFYFEKQPEKENFGELCNLFRFHSTN